EPEVVRLLLKDVEACLTFYHCDHRLHPLIRSTNLLERFFREFRTKADEIGAFPNELSCLVVFHLIVIRDDAKHDPGQTAKLYDTIDGYWHTQKPIVSTTSYMSLSITYFFCTLYRFFFHYQIFFIIYSF